MFTPVLLVAVAVTVMLVPATANASEPIEVLQEPTSAHCGASPNCKTHWEGEVFFYAHFFGVESLQAKCHVEYEATTDEDGNGSITGMTNTNGGHGDTNCPTVMPPCTGDLPWPTASEEVGVNVTKLTVSSMCIDPSEFLTCEGVFQMVFTEEGNPGQTETQHVNDVDTRIGSSFCEFSTVMESEDDGTHPRLHQRHPML